MPNGEIDSLSIDLEKVPKILRLGTDNPYLKHVRRLSWRTIAKKLIDDPVVYSVTEVIPISNILSHCYPG